MRFLSHCCSFWFVSSCLALASGGDPGSSQGSKQAVGKATEEKPRHATPEATHEAAKAAAAKHDYHALCRLLTPEAQEELAAGLVMVGQFMQALPPEKEDAAKGQVKKL